MTSLALTSSAPPFKQIPSPGAVCPATVIWGWSMPILPPLPFLPSLRSMTPDTAKTTMRLGWLTASARLPGPEAFKLVTR